MKIRLISLLILLNFTSNILSFEFKFDSYINSITFYDDYPKNRATINVDLFKYRYGKLDDKEKEFILQTALDASKEFVNCLNQNDPLSLARLISNLRLKILEKNIKTKFEGTFEDVLFVNEFKKFLRKLNSHIWPGHFNVKKYAKVDIKIINAQNLSQKRIDKLDSLITDFEKELNGNITINYANEIILKHKKIFDEQGINLLLTFETNNLYTFFHIKDILARAEVHIENAYYKHYKKNKIFFVKASLKDANNLEHDNILRLHNLKQSSKKQQKKD